MGADQAEMPFLDHLEELRRRVIWSLVALVALSVLGFFLVTELDVIGILERPFHHVLPDGQLSNLELVGISKTHCAEMVGIDLDYG